ncbi:hypothetical protein [Filimonas effusa]|uniref:Uncharacterized protein n=1 Tax=Filimonas effusa TaxID=2508721 RepID=A0A4Q1CZD6_9BACT|nr:hypothetical protein [Filimonas effusa]RXK80768.1 hypothetical protein ESB13_21640 [Filimonas effusa]
MNTRNSLFNLAVVCLLFSCCLLQACKKPSEGVEVTVNTDIYTSPMLFHFANASSTATTQPADFEVTVTGQNATSVVTPEGGKTFKTKGGVLALMLEKTAAPSAEHPVNFSLVANVEGFTPVVQNVTIISDSVYTKEVRLVEYAKPADGTSARVQQATLLSGSLVTAATIATSTTASTTEMASIALPAGTKFFAENGTQITSGNLDAKVVYYGTGTQASLDAFPGGFNANNILGENGQSIPGGVTFVTAGFLAVNMKVGNTVVKSFSQPLQVTMQISSTLVNPNTGVVVKAGDIIPIWSLDEKTGQWKFETNGTISTSGGKLLMTYNMAHLSYWNIDWPYYMNGTSSCYKSSSAPVKVTVKAGVNSFYGKIYLATASGQPLTTYAGGMATIYNNGVYNFYGSTPNMTGVKVIVADQFGVKLAESAAFNPCSTGELTVTVPSSVTFPKLTTVDLKINARCSNKNIVANVTNAASLYLWNGTAYTYYKTVYVYNGVAKFNLLNDQRYRIDTYYGSKSYSAVMDFKSANFNFTGATTNASLTGVATYNSGTNIYRATADIAVNCN